MNIFGGEVVLKKSENRLETLLLILNESDLLEESDIDRLFSRFSVIQNSGVRTLIIYANILSVLPDDQKEALCRLLKENILKKSESFTSIEGFECHVFMDYESVLQNDADFSVYFLLGLGGRDELKLILEQFIQKCSDGSACSDDLTPDSISSQMKIPFEPDFIISGSKNTLTDFMIWQTAYSEYAFPEKEFIRMTDFEISRLLESFNKRKRRFGV